MKVVADLQIHSRFSRAVSPQMTLPVIADWARKKGIGLVATGDWTHPVWVRELRAGLVEAGEGFFRLRGQNSPLFLLSTEISSIYSSEGKTRRIHTLVFAPDFVAVEKIIKNLTDKGANLLSDGRPIVGLSAKEVAEIALSADERCLIIPAHAWTPWYSLYGSKSGFDSIQECFGPLSTEIYAVETGLSSDPAMNWRIRELESRSIVSFSDAHSPQKLGREATVFDLEKASFQSLKHALKKEADSKIDYTIEFYPEEGKYHYTGHRACGVSLSPGQVKQKGVICPVCGKSLTVGVMNRVEWLATEKIEVETEKDKVGLRWIKKKGGGRPPYVMLVPLVEIISESLDVGVATKSVIDIYESLVSSIGPEFKILMEAEVNEIEKVAGPRVAEGVARVRGGDIFIKPGFDGVFGEVKIWKKEEEEDSEVNQTTLF